MRDAFYLMFEMNIDGPFRKFDAEEIGDIFSYHAPTEEQRAIYEFINRVFIDAATELAKVMPDGPGKTAAIRALADARMKCNAAVSLQGKF